MPKINLWAVVVGALIYMALGFLNSGYHLTAVVLIGALVAAWRKQA